MTLNSVDHGTLVLDRNVTSQELKSILQHNSEYHTLIIVECDRLDADCIQEHLQFVNAGLKSLIVQETVWFNDETLELITAYCHRLKKVELVGCLVNVTTTGIESIGRNCGNLEALSIICAEERNLAWQLTDKVFPALINSSSSNLGHFALSGFSTISFEAMKNLLRNFSQSLVSLDVSSMSIIDDNALNEIGGICKGLASLDVSRCENISDNGIATLANQCHKLEKIKLCGLESLMDSSILLLSKCCPELKDVCLDYCLNLSERSLDHLARHCPLLRSISMRNTSVGYMPYRFSTLESLVECNFSECDQLVEDNCSVNTTSVELMMRKAMMENIRYRTKVMVLGGPQSGKTSTLIALQSSASAVADGKTYDIPVHVWMPLMEERMSESTNADDDDDAIKRQLTVELWDCSGQKCLQGVHPFFMTTRSLFLLLFNSSVYNSPDRIVHSIMAIHAKVPGAFLILVASHSDMATEEAIQSTFQGVDKALAASETQEIDKLRQSIDNLRSLDPSHLIKQQISSLEFLIANRPKIIQKTAVSAITSKGLTALSDTIVKEIQANMPPLDLLPGAQDLYDEIVRLRHRGCMIQQNEDVRQLCSGIGVTREADQDALLSQLEDMGCILRYDLPGSQFPPPASSTICIDPASFANAMALLHRHEENPQELVNCLQKGGHINRLWPHSKPNDWTLRGAFSNITGSGMIRETIIPLLLNKWDLKEQEAVRIISLMQRLNILVSGAPNASYDVELLLPNFPQLSVYKRFFLPQLNKLPVIPQVNAWLTTCPTTHLEVGWRYCFNKTPHACIFLFLISSVTNVKHSCEILSFWQSGVYLRIGDVDVAVMVTKEGDALDLLARVRNTTGSVQALGLAWSILARFLFVVDKFLTTCRGLYVERFVLNAKGDGPLPLVDLLSECLAADKLPTTILRLIPNFGLELLKTNGDLDSMTSSWLFAVSVRVVVYIYHSEEDCEPVKSLLHHIQSVGLICACPSTLGAKEEARFISSCSLCLVVVNSSRQDYSTTFDSDLIRILDDRGVSIVVAFLDNNPSSDRLPDTLKDKPSVDISSSENGTTSISKEKIKSLVTVCRASLFGTGDVEATKQQPQDSGQHHEEHDNDDEFLGGDGSPSTLKINQLRIKRSVQFADQSPRHHHNRMETDGELKQLAASTVAAAVAAATAEHIAKQSNPTMGAKAAAMAAKVADAVARGDSEAAAKAVIATARAVDEVVAMRAHAAEKSSLQKPNGVNNNNDSGDAQNQDDDSRKKSAVCVIL